jgi:regulator of protease activity HflC (stomatin/prohibitin superfamily)
VAEAKPVLQPTANELWRDFPAIAIEFEKRFTTKEGCRAYVPEKIKVNDLRGNPIEMAAQVGWRVTDTAQALFDVDDYKALVEVQIEAAVRTIGSRYPYDDLEPPLSPTLGGVLTRMG